MGVVDFLAEIAPAGLRERVWAAVYHACSEVIATDPQLAAAAHLQRGRMSLARGNDDAAVQDFQAAVASQDARAVYYAARHLLQMGGYRSLAPGWVGLHDAGIKWTNAYETALDRSGIGLHGGRKSHYTREIREWAYSINELLFTVHPTAILAWLQNRRGHTLALPALDRFYAAAADLGYATNPMPTVRQYLGIEQGVSVHPHSRTHQIS